MKTAYVACHDRWAACHVASVLRTAGIQITSRWHDRAFLPSEQHSQTERQGIARDDCEDIRQADALVLVAGSDRYPGGKFFEAGLAFGLGKRVIVVGRRENMLLWHPAILQVETPEQAVIFIQSEPA